MESIKIPKKLSLHAQGMYRGSRNEIILPLTEKNARDFCYVNRNDKCPHAKEKECMKCILQSHGGYTCYPFESVVVTDEGSGIPKNMEYPLRSVYFGHSQQGVKDEAHRLSYVFEVDVMKNFANQGRVLQDSEAMDYISRTKAYCDRRWFGNGNDDECLIMDAVRSMAMRIDDPLTGINWLEYDNYMSLDFEKDTNRWRMERFRKCIMPSFDYALVDTLILLYGLADLHGFPVNKERTKPLNHYEFIANDIWFAREHGTNTPSYPFIGMFEEMALLMNDEEVPLKATLSTLTRIMLGNYTFGEVMLGCMSYMSAIAFIRQWCSVLYIDIDKVTDIILQNYNDSII